MNPLWPEPGPPDAQCGTCVWHYRGGRGRAVDRCRRHDGARVGAEATACPAHETALDCLRCGACCREAYHAVEVGHRDPFVKQHPDFLVRVDGRLQIARTSGICACLAPASGQWPCTVYSDRPKTCRDFEVASDNCLIARRRLGLTP
jgi:hypothetical protein